MNSGFGVGGESVRSLSVKRRRRRRRRIKREEEEEDDEEPNEKKKKKKKEETERNDRMVKRRGLINETYAAAADTKMHCKYTEARKTIVPERDLYLSQLHSRRTVQFFSLAGQFVELRRSFLHEPRGSITYLRLVDRDRYTRAHARQQNVHPNLPDERPKRKKSRKAHPRGLTLARKSCQRFHPTLYQSSPRYATQALLV